MEITQILILILLLKPQSDHFHLSYISPLQYYQILYATSVIIYHREPIIQHNYITLLSKLLSWHPHPHNFPPPIQRTVPTLVSKIIITTFRFNSSK